MSLPIYAHINPLCQRREEFHKNLQVTKKHRKGFQMLSMHCSTFLLITLFVTRCISLVDGFCIDAIPKNSSGKSCKSRISSISMITPRFNNVYDQHLCVNDKNLNMNSMLSTKGRRSRFLKLSTSTEVRMFSAATASLIAGSIAGAIGVGVAFPLDTLKTKSQVLGQQMKTPDGNGKEIGQLGMFDIISLVWEQEGISGFFGGVKGMMIGQAFIKAMAFSANAFALEFLIQAHERYSQYTFLSHFTAGSFYTLVVAACFAGFVTSFIVAPVERVKVMLQASGNALYQNELECISAVLKSEGWSGLLGRGLTPTILREVPSYAIYFVVYGILIQTPFAKTLGVAAPLVFGAMSGCASWIPVYPIDVVKTLMQNTEGGSNKEEAEDKGQVRSNASAIEISKQLYEEGGIGAFFDGLTPKMLRAAVNHAVTFWIYDLIIKKMSA